MKVTDVSTFVNELVEQMTGSKDVTVVDNQNIVDIGKKLESAFGTENTYKAICDKVAKQVFLNKSYTNRFGNLMKDSWEWGNILEEIRIKPMKATTDPSYNPVSGTDYKLTEYNAAEVETTYYTDFDNFQVEYWRDGDQLWNAFKSLEAFAQFESSLEIEAINAIEKRTEALCKTAITNMIAEVLDTEIPDAAYGTHSTLKAVNVLKEFKTIHPDSTVTAANCIYDPDFGKFLIERVMDARDNIGDLSVEFNVQGAEEYTLDPTLIMLSKVANAVKVNAQSNVYNKELVELPNYSTVSYWQGSNGYGFDGVSKINQTIKNKMGQTKTINATGIIGVLFDSMAVCVNREYKKTTTFYHPNLDRTKIFSKYTAQYINRLSKNFIVFYVADAA